MAPAIPLLLAFLAQAEPAPPEAPALAPPPVASLAQAEPAPPEAPALAPPLVEPALRPTPLPAPGTEPEPLPNSVGIRAGVGYQISGDVQPRLGYTLGMLVGWRYAALGDVVALSVEGQFDFDRYSRNVTISSLDGDLPPREATRMLSFFQFSAMQVAAPILRAARPWLGVGAGVVVGHFESAEAAFQPGESRTTRPVVLAAAGLDLPLARGTSLGLHVGYAHPVNAPSLALDSGLGLRAFGDRLWFRPALLHVF
jgi:hypothetical protein